MSAILGSVTKLLVPCIISRSHPRIIIEEWSFRLHFRFTTLFLFLFSALLCMRQYIGDHIKCQPNHDDDANDPIIPRNVLETYCFIQTTFTIPYDPRVVTAHQHRQNQNIGGPQYIAGVTPRVHHAYYQWMPFYLFFLGLCFLFTHRVWKSVDNRKIQHLVLQLNIRDLSDATKRSEKVAKVARYLAESKATHGFWAAVYIFCEWMNLVIILSAMYLTDIFLKYEFSSYGPKVIKFLDSDPETRVDPMATVFPRITKCLFHMYGPSGNVQRFDSLCILPSNILNEKIFTFLWFWFLFVAIISAGAILYRLATLVSRKIRLNSLIGSGFSVEFPLHLESVTVIRKLGISDWLLLRFIKFNLDSETFKILLKRLYEELM